MEGCRGGRTVSPVSLRRTRLSPWGTGAADDPEQGIGVIRSVPVANPFVLLCVEGGEEA